MPNWCYTSLTVTGDTQEVSRFVKGIKTRQEEIGADNPSILDTYFPTPQELHITEGFVGEEKQKELDVLYAANTEKFGHRSWYDWNCENWGSKWHDCNTYIQDDSEDLNEVVFSFETAWSPISQGIKHISSLFPTLGFVLSYNEEAGFYVGSEAYLAGEQLFFGQQEPDYPEQAENEEDDAYYTRIDEGRNDLQSQLEEGAENALFTALERLG